MMRIKPKHIVKTVLVVMAVVLFIPQLTAQGKLSKKQEKMSNSYLRKAEGAKAKGDFAGAEANYRMAIANDEKNAEGNYNFGHLYTDKKMEAESMKQLLNTAKNAKSRDLRHKAFHNLGNSYMVNEDYAQAVNAYKDALRNDPTDDETRYNLAIAKDKLENEQNQSDKDDDQGKDDDDQNEDQNHGQNDDKDKSEDEDQNEENKDNKESKGENDQDQDQQNQEQQGQGEGDQMDGEPVDQGNQENEQNQEGEMPEQPEDGVLSDKQAENLLKAAERLEKGTQQKRNKKKGEEVPVNPNKKDW